MFLLFNILNFWRHFSYFSSLIALCHWPIRCAVTNTLKPWAYLRCPKINQSQRTLSKDPRMQLLNLFFNGSDHVVMNRINHWSIKNLFLAIFKFCQTSNRTQTRLKSCLKTLPRVVLSQNLIVLWKRTYKGILNKKNCVIVTLIFVVLLFIDGAVLNNLPKYK